MTILIADDDRQFSQLLTARLKDKGFKVLVACDVMQAVMAAIRNIPDAILLDMNVGGGTVDVLRKLKASMKTSTIPVIVLSPVKDREVLKTIEDLGADELLPKPVDLEHLERTLGRLLARTDVQEALLPHSSLDNVTGLWDRAAILDVLRREMARSQREGNPVGVVVAHLDPYKRINSTYGHLAGDAVLRETARRMRASIRVYDSIGRYGDEEFLLVLPGCDAGRALNRAEKLCAWIRKDLIDTAAGPLQATLSLGAASNDEIRDLSPEAIQRAAELALSRAKGNKVELATSEDYTKSQAAN